VEARSAVDSTGVFLMVLSHVAGLIYTRMTKIKNNNNWQVRSLPKETQVKLRDWSLDRRNQKQDCPLAISFFLT
jgi:hypothetical protein